ncbi:MAG: hypothetical protein VCF25_00525 [Candidatus Poribacteria bacterium]
MITNVINVFMGHSFLRETHSPEGRHIRIFWYDPQVEPDFTH